MPPIGEVQGGMGEAAAAAVRTVHRVSGLEAARQLYRQLLRLPPAGGTFFHALLDMEQAAASTSERLSHAAWLQLYEVCISSCDWTHRDPFTLRIFLHGVELDVCNYHPVCVQVAVDAYGVEDDELWLRYVQHSMQRKKGVGMLYWRATKALHDPQGFEQKYHKLQQQKIIGKLPDISALP